MTSFNNDPVFGKQQRTAIAKVSTATAVANTDLDITPTNFVKIPLNGASNGAPVGGCVITKLVAHLVEPAITGAAVLKLYLSKDNGVSMYCIKDIIHASVTLSASVSSPDDDFGYTESAPLRLEDADQIFVQARGASATTDAFHVHAQYTELQQ